jgi:hypothetical protein
MKKVIKKIIRKIYPQKNILDLYWSQKVEITRLEDRFKYFVEKCEEKKVLHFGCCDWPVFNPDKNLHIELSKYTTIIHGFDVDKEGIENLKKYVPQEYFSEYADIPSTEYDVCLIPETIEHVDNVKIFLEAISKVNAKLFIITGPNCFAPIHMERNSNSENEFIEIIHPDHNCWYSPYTLKNQIEKYSNLKVQKTILLEKETMICCESISIK